MNCIVEGALLLEAEKISLDHILLGLDVLGLLHPVIYHLIVGLQHEVQQAHMDRCVLHDVQFTLRHPSFDREVLQS